MAKLKDDEIVALLRIELDAASSYQTKSISQQRIEAMKYYNAEPYGDELDERSKVVTTEVRDTVESILPQLIKIFLSTDQVVKFEPSTQEDEEGAKQSTDYINYVIQRDNDGFMLFYTMFKDALLQKNGIVKTFWDVTEKTSEETYRCLLDIELKALLNDDECEPVAIEKYEESLPPGVDGMGMPLPAAPTTLYNVTIKRTNKHGRARAVPVPPDEFLISTRAASIKGARLVAHKTRKTISDLIEMGFKKDDVWDLPSDEDAMAAAEVTERFNDDGGGLPADSEAVQQALREVTFTESYFLVDTDDDGVAEKWKISTGGTSTKLLKKERWDGPWPFSAITPIPMPHKFFGKSIHDVVKDIQRIKSTVMRQLLDNVYNINNNRTFVQEDMVNLDDLLTNRPNGIIRTKGNPGTVAMPYAPQPIGGILIPTLEYLDTVHENRTGLTKYNQGLDSNSLNKTATGITAIMSAAQERILLIARIFAETGVSDIFRQLLHLTCRYQDKPRTIMLRGKWVPMNPSSWNAEMDTSVDVALGTQNQQVMTAFLLQLLGIQEKAMANPTTAALVTPTNLYNTIAKLCETAGFKNVGSYVTDPESAPSQQGQQGPAPEVQKAQLEAQADAAKTQATTQSAEKIALLNAQGKKAELQQRSASDAAKIEADKQAAREANIVKLITALMSSSGDGQADGTAEKPAGEGKKPRIVRLDIDRHDLTGDARSLIPIYDDVKEEAAQ